MTALSRIVKIDVMVLQAPSPRPMWSMTEKDFSRFGGFRGVQALAEERRTIAVVCIDKITPNMPRLRRNGSPFTRIMGLYVGNVHPAERDDFIAWFCTGPDFSKKSVSLAYMFKNGFIDAVTND